MKTKLLRATLILTLVIGIGPCLLHGEAEKHWWKFDEAKGIIAKDSIGKVNGILNGNAAFLGPEKGVHINKNKDSYVSFDRSVGQFGTNDFSVFLEFKTKETLSLYSVVGNRFSTRYGNYFCIHMVGQNDPFGEQGTVTVELCENPDGKNYFPLNSTRSRLNDGNWHSLKVVRKRKEISLYIDHVLDSKITTPRITNIRGEHEFRLGQSLNPKLAIGEFTPDATYKNLKIEIKR
jgi:hypothetical protein